MASPLPWGERVRVRGNGLMVTPTLVLPHRGGGEFLENWMPRSSAAGYFTSDLGMRISEFIVQDQETLSLFCYSAIRNPNSAIVWIMI